jgi:hypothetical protein
MIIFWAFLEFFFFFKFVMKFINFVGFCYEYDEFSGIEDEVDEGGR